MSIKSLVTKLETVLMNLDPPMPPRFAPPATKKKIAAAEKSLGVKFPAELCEFLLYANGQSEDAYDESCIVPTIRFGKGRSQKSAWGYFANLERIVGLTQWRLPEEGEEYPFDGVDSQGRSTRKFFGPVGHLSRDSMKIFFTYADDAVSLAIDLAPLKGGKVGQVVTINDQPDYSAVIAPSLSAFLRIMIDGYRSGRFKRQKKYGTMGEA
jgi:cell wall assembly regulator SMI1